MPSSRGLVVFAAGVCLWVAARLIGSPDLHMVAVGVTVLPLAAALFVRWTRHTLIVRRRLSAAKLSPGQRLTVEIEVENRSLASTSFVLLEDQVPPALGRPARLVLTGLPGRNSQRVAYTVICRSRGRYSLGPLRLDLSDPFALTKVRMEYPGRDDVIVFPEVEDLSAEVHAPHGSGAGQSASRHLFRSGEEFYTMREYQIGDDLRRIHWPSVARRGELMIRQDESARRSLATVFLDTRASALGEVHTPAFERAVSAAASLGSHMARSGFALRLAAGGGKPHSLTEEHFLETLAQVGHTPSRPLSSALLALRTSAVADTTLVVVTAPPNAAESAALVRIGTAFGPKIAVLIYPHEPASLPPEPRSRLERQASSARVSLARAGWDVVVLSPNRSLREAWQTIRKKLPAATVFSR